jgi:tetratricopeptide (TPR) repeat protein
LFPFHINAQEAKPVQLDEVDSLMKMLQYEEVLDILDKADNLSNELLLRKGQALYQLGASGQAIEPFELLLQREPENTSALIYLGQLYARNYSYTEALRAFEKLIGQDSSNSYYYKQAGTMARSSGRIDTAILWYDKALTYNPSDVETAHHLASIYLGRGMFPQADVVIERGLSIDPDFRPLGILSAKSAFDQKKYGEAIEISNQVVEKGDTTILLARIMGVSYYHMDKFQEVIPCMKYLVYHLVDQDWVYYYLGIANRELGDLEASVGWLHLAVDRSLSENTSVYYNNIGQNYEALGDFENAIKAYRNAHTYSGKDIYFYHLARNYDIYYQDKSTAVLYYKKYLDSQDTTSLARDYAVQRLRTMGHF